MFALHSDNPLSEAVSVSNERRPRGNTITSNKQCVCGLPDIHISGYDRKHLKDNITVYTSVEIPLEELYSHFIHIGGLCVTLRMVSGGAAA